MRHAPCAGGTSATMGVVDGDLVAVSVLELAWRTRPGGGGRSERRFLDFVIEGVSLYDRLTRRGDDLISPLGWHHGDDTVRQRLRPEQPLLIDGVREPIMVCPECGEVSCGAVVARVGARRGLVNWAAFAWYNGYEAAVDDDDLEPVTFELHAYHRALVSST